MLLFILAAALMQPGAGHEISGHAYVVSGDQLIVDGLLFRLAGIAAPRPGQDCHQSNGTLFRCGLLAKDRLESLVREEIVHCSRPEQGFAFCTVRGEDLGSELLRLGFALPSRRASTQHYREIGERARAERRGILWARFEYPEDWDRSQDSRTNPNCPVSPS